MTKLLALPVVLAMLGGCATHLPVANGPASPTPVAQAVSQAVVANSLMGGNKSVAITIAPPKEGGFQVQTVQHHWTSADIFQYTASLKVWNGTAYVDFTTPLSVTIPQKGTAPKTQAVFTNLKQGQKYQVELIAQGNNGGTAAAATLNGNSATTQVFDFTATQDVEDTLSGTLTITFDSVSFSGTGTATVGTPSDGTYTNPTAAESGAAQ